jgi:UDP-glucose:(heptosyl)LPS alpha-1,3-glucosyltransferase
MRIVLVYPACHRRGGVERVVWEAARALSPAHEVVLVAGEAEDLPTEVRWVKVPGAPFAGVRGLVGFARASARALNEIQDDITVAFGVNCAPCDCLVMGSVHAAWLELGQAVRLHGVTVPPVMRRSLPRHQVRVIQERRRLSDKRLRRVIAVSPGEAQDITRIFGYPAQSIDVVPNGFDPSQCSPDRRQALRSAQRASLGLAPDEVALLLIANEYHRKGLAVLLEAMAQVGDSRVRLLLVGSVAPDAYRAQIAHLGLTRQVQYCGATNDVALFHAAADLFVLPTQYEAFGMVIVEALASGLPVIASALAGASAAIRHGENGLAIEDPNDADELTDLLKIGMDDDTRRRWSAQAPESVRDYSWQVVMSKFEASLVRVAQEKHR